jgi:molybdate transport system ATP-binding protein
MNLEVTLRHRFAGFALDVAFTAPAGVTSLFGRSGAGKTTIVNAVAGLLRPDHARVVAGGKVLADSDAGIWLPPHKRRVGYVFQEGRLFPHLDVRRNLDYGRRVSGAPHDAAGFGRVVGMLGIGGLLDRHPAKLSGGEKQRVAIGRALLMQPRLLLLDEPLAALDEARKAEILPFLGRIRDEASVPILHVSHSAAEVARLATTVVMIDAGRVIACGPASTVLSDPSLAPTGVRAVGAVLTAKVVAHHDDGLSEIDAGGTRLFLPRLAQAHGTALRIRIAAHDVILSREAPVGLSALNILAGTVEAIHTGDGPGAIVSVATQAGNVLARVTRRSVARLDLAPGIRCHAILKTVAIAPEDIGTGPA